MTPEGCRFSHWIEPTFERKLDRCGHFSTRRRRSPTESPFMHFSPLSSSTSQCLNKSRLKQVEQSGENLHSRGCSSTDGKLHVEVSFIIVKHYHDVLNRKSIYICFLGQISCLSDVTCPSPYLYVPGDVSGPGTLDYETHSMDNMTRYIRGFSNGINFIEKLPEISISHFCFVQVCRAVQWEIRLPIVWIFSAKCCLLIQFGGGYVLSVHST